jgi:5-methyltetrahydrofolate--homocysteine methyltransferase
MVDRRCPGLVELLDERGVLVADGAMGTALFDMGLETGGCPELLNVEQPELIARVHDGYLDAGADIVLTNTFGGTRARLDLHGLGDRVAELNRAGVRIARERADRRERCALVAGSMGPTGELYEPLGALTHTDAVAAFSEQAEALVSAGVDVLWIETISSLDELSAAVEAASGREIPVVATLSFDTNGRTMMGVEPARLARWWEDRGRPIAAVGANCGVGPPDVVEAARAIAETAPDAVVVAKGNCGIPLYKDEALTYPSTPEDMAAYTELAVRSGARIVGACCGSGFSHVAVIRRTIDAGIGGGVPDVGEIADRLGEVSSQRPASPARRRRRRSSD